MDCLEAGESLTSVNIAKRLNISRVAVWLFRKRNPIVDGWSDAILADRASAQWGAVKYRMAMVALQGSVQHADQFCKMEANTYANRGWQPVGTSEEDRGPGRIPDAVINILCPRPELYASAFNDVPNGGPSPRPSNPTAPDPPTPPSLPDGVPVVAAKVPR